MRQYGQSDRLKEALELADREWHATFDSISDAIWILDSDSRIIRANKAAVELFGKQILGRQCWKVVHGGSGPIHVCPALRMRETLQRESMELRLGDRWFQITVDPILDKARNLTGIVHIMRDITSLCAGLLTPHAKQPGSPQSPQGDFASCSREFIRRDNTLP